MCVCILNYTKYILHEHSSLEATIDTSSRVHEKPLKSLQAVPVNGCFIDILTESDSFSFVEKLSVYLG